MTLCQPHSPRPQPATFEGRFRPTLARQSLFCQRSDATEEGSSRLLHGHVAGPFHKTELPLRVAGGDVLGIGIDYKQATVFLTHNGKLLPLPKTIPARLSKKWRPYIGARGEATVRFNFGSRRFVYDLAEHEASVWKGWLEAHRTRQLFESYHQFVHDGAHARGWPWSGGGTWDALLDSHVLPWVEHMGAIDDMAEQSVRRRRKSEGHSSGGPSAVVPPPCSKLAAADAALAAVDEAPGGRVEDQSTSARGPTRLRLWPSPDPLSVSEVDVDRLSQFAARWELPEASARQLASVGLCVGRMAELPLQESTELARRAGMQTGVRLRLCGGIRCELGARLPIRPGAAAGEADACVAAAGGLSRALRPPMPRPRRSAIVYELPRPMRMVVLLSPSLPVRALPDLRCPSFESRRRGEVVLVVARCNGWVQLQPRQRGTGTHAALSAGRRSTTGTSEWVLHDGRHVGQPGSLLRPLGPGDTTVGGLCVGVQPARETSEASDGADCVAVDDVLARPLVDAAVGVVSSSDADHALQQLRAFASRFNTAAAVTGCAARALSPPTETDVAESQRFATLSPEGQGRREADLLGLLELASLPSRLAAPLLTEGASVRLFSTLPLAELAILMRRAGLHAADRLSLAVAVRRYLQLGQVHPAVPAVLPHCPSVGVASSAPPKASSTCQESSPPREARVHSEPRGESTGASGLVGSAVESAVEGAVDEGDSEREEATRALLLQANVPVSFLNPLLAAGGSAGRLRACSAEELSATCRRAGLSMGARLKLVQAILAGDGESRAVSRNLTGDCAVQAIIAGDAPGAPGPSPCDRPGLCVGRVDALAPPAGATAAPHGTPARSGQSVGEAAGVHVAENGSVSSAGAKTIARTGPAFEWTRQWRRGREMATLLSLAGVPPAYAPSLQAAGASVPMLFERPLAQLGACFARADLPVEAQVLERPPPTPPQPLPLCRTRRHAQWSWRAGTALPNLVPTPRLPFYSRHWALTLRSSARAAAQAGKGRSTAAGERVGLSTRQRV